MAFAEDFTKEWKTSSEAKGNRTDLKKKIKELVDFHSKAKELSVNSRTIIIFLIFYDFSH